MSDQIVRIESGPATAYRSARPSLRRSRLAALCAIALVCVSGSLLMELAGGARFGVPLGVGWMFGPPGTISVR